MEEKTIKARDLKRQICQLPDDADVFFGPNGELSFNRVKRRGHNFYQIEFNEWFTVTSDPAQSDE